MQCPECNREMVQGELRLHRSHVARVIFSPLGEKSGGVMASVGPRFVKVSGEQAEVAFSGKTGSQCVSHGDAHRCPACGLLVIRNV
jgi:hypothetical protein